MFERFTDRGRRVVVLAQQEARLLDHNYIGTEHLLLGLIHEGEGVAASALEALGIRLEAVRAEVEEIIGRGSDPPGGHIPFTPRAKRVLELSLREALDLGHGHIGTEHILLGLIREGEGVAAQVLVKLGADLSRARLQVLQVLATTAEASPEQVATGRRVPAAPVMVPGSPPGLAEQPVELVRVLPLDRELVRRHGYRLQLISLEVWSGWLDLRYALLPEEPPPAPPMREVVLGWRLTDDAGTSYELGGAASSGGRLLRILQLSFQPAPPATARTLTLTVQDEQGADLATAEIPLGGAS